MIDKKHMIWPFDFWQNMLAFHLNLDEAGMINLASFLYLTNNLKFYVRWRELGGLLNSRDPHGENMFNGSTCVSFHAFLGNT